MNFLFLNILELWEALTRDPKEEWVIVQPGGNTGNNHILKSQFRNVTEVKEMSFVKVFKEISDV